MASSPNKADFFEASRAGVADHELRRKLENASGRHLEHVAEMRAEFLPFEAERDTARRMGLVTLSQMVAALVRAVEQPPASGTVRVVDVPMILAARLS